MKLKNVLHMGLSLVLVAAVSIGGTVAFLTSTDNDVNTMVAGNVEIAQNEYQYDRAESKFEAFEDGKPALPAVFNNGEGNKTSPSWQTGENGEDFYLTLNNDDQFRVWSENDHNIIDKFVTVKNEGNTDVYFRTIIAFEIGDIPINGNNAGADGSRYIRTAANYDGSGSEDDYFDFTLEILKGDADKNFTVVEINGQNYIVKTFTHKTLLAAGTESSPSLRQLLLGHGVTSEMIESLGTNWEVIALSQAVQAGGFKDATTALDKGFGDVTAENVAKWFADIAPKNARS